MSIYGKRPERYGLLVEPSFEEAIGLPRHKIELPARKYTKQWESPAFQALLGLNQDVETDAELEARKAQLKLLMTRVAKEHQVPLAHVQKMTTEWAKAGLFDEPAEDDAESLSDWYDGPPPPPPGGGGVRGREPRPPEQQPEPQPAQPPQPPQPPRPPPGPPPPPRGFRRFTPGDTSVSSGSNPPPDPPPGPPGPRREQASGSSGPAVYHMASEDEVEMQMDNRPPPPPSPPHPDSTDRLFRFMRREIRRDRLMGGSHRPDEQPIPEKRPPPDSVEVIASGRPPPPPPPAPAIHIDSGLIQTNRMIQAQMRQNAHDHMLLQEAAKRLEEERVAMHVASQMKEQQRQEEMLAAYRQMQSAATASASASAAAAAAAHASRGSNVAHQFVIHLNQTIQASGGPVPMEPIPPPPANTQPMPVKQERIRPDPTPAPTRGTKRAGEEIPFQRRARPAHLDNRRLIAAAAKGAKREAEEAPALNPAEAAALAPYAAKGDLNDVIANAVLDLMEKPREPREPAREPREAQPAKKPRQEAPKRNRFLKYAEHLKKKVAEKKAREKQEKQAKKAKSEAKVPKVKADKGAVKVTPTGRSRRVEV